MKKAIAAMIILTVGYCALRYAQDREHAEDVIVSMSQEDYDMCVEAVGPDIIAISDYYMSHR